MRKRYGQERKLLIRIAAVAALAVMLVIANCLLVTDQQSAVYEEQIEAVERYLCAVDVLKQFRVELNIPLSDEDFHKTGLIGEVFTPLTTTVGDAGAKRTAATPDMAALVVRIFSEAGVERGDIVAANMSGSFPGLNLAFLAACQAMGLRPVYTVSASASMYGANIPGFSFPDMVLRLHKEGFLEWLPQAVSIGGDQDIGSELDSSFRNGLKADLEKSGLPLLYEPDFARNVRLRMSIYEAFGQPKLFVSIGGHTASLGLDDLATIRKQGILRPRYSRIDDKSGLIARYLSRNVTVVQLINIKRLAADYGMAFDPPVIPPVGQSAIYKENSYPVWLSVCSLVLIAGLLFQFYRQRKRAIYEQTSPV